MTDNEKRAHDLAMKTIEIEQIKLLESLEGDKTAPFSIYPIYKQSFDQYLELLSRDYS